MAEETGTALVGCRIWVTRPRDQAWVLCDLIRGAAGEAVEFPLMEIVAAPDPDAARTTLGRLAQFDLCIFISRNAVRCALALQPGLARAAGGCRMFAVGAGTAAELSGGGIKAASGPGPAHGADDLLTLPQLQAQAVRGCSILIVRGVGGEALLREELERRGARVQYAEVYQRRRPDPDRDRLRRLWQQTPPDVIVLTSTGGVRALPELTPLAEHTRLLRTALVVISDRVCAAARGAGFTGAVLVAAGASDLILFQTLLKWRSNR
jgi:uroporphyrinogen-III synthase